MNQWQRSKNMLSQQNY